jgi:hypothetical protein
MIITSLFLSNSISENSYRKWNDEEKNQGEHNRSFLLLRNKC